MAGDTSDVYHTDPRAMLFDSPPPRFQHRGHLMLPIRRPDTTPVADGTPHYDGLYTPTKGKESRRQTPSPIPHRTPTAPFQSKMLSHPSKVPRTQGVATPTVGAYSSPKPHHPTLMPLTPQKPSEEESRKREEPLYNHHDPPKKRGSGAQRSPHPGYHRHQDTNGSDDDDDRDLDVSRGKIFFKVLRKRLQQSGSISFLDLEQAEALFLSALDQAKRNRRFATECRQHRDEIQKSMDRLYEETMKIRIENETNRKAADKEKRSGAHARNARQCLEKRMDAEVATLKQELEELHKKHDATVAKMRRQEATQLRLEGKVQTTEVAMSFYKKQCDHLEETLSGYKHGPTVTTMRTNVAASEARLRTMEAQLSETEHSTRKRIEKVLAKLRHRDEEVVRLRSQLDSMQRRTKLAESYVLEYCGLAGYYDGRRARKDFIRAGAASPMMNDDRALGEMLKRFRRLENENYQLRRQLGLSQDKPSSALPDVYQDFLRNGGGTPSRSPPRERVGGASPTHRAGGDAECDGDTDTDTDAGLGQHPGAAAMGNDGDDGGGGGAGGPPAAAEESTADLDADAAAGAGASSDAIAASEGDGGRQSGDEMNPRINDGECAGSDNADACPDQPSPNKSAAEPHGDDDGGVGDGGGDADADGGSASDEGGGYDSPGQGSVAFSEEDEA
eukprot:Rmarinus@m.7300